MTPATWSVRCAAVVASAALVLTGCGGDDGEGGDADATTSASPTPSTTVEVPEGVELTDAGTQLVFGETATVAYEAGDVAGVLDLTVDSAEQGSIKDLQGFDLDDPYKKRGNYYYVRVSVENAGDGNVGDIPVPLWGVSGENTLLRAVTFTTSFKKCPTENLPKKFKPGDSFKTCLVYLSPDHGSLEGVSYRPTEAYDPIEWEGKVKPLPEPKKKPKKKQQ
jgi:hypothetical protein